MPASRWFRLLLVCLGFLPLLAGAWERGDVDRFATLPAGSSAPEGIAADGAGNIYAGTFAVPPRSTPGQVIVFDRNGRLLRTLDVQGSSSQLLGLDFHPNGKLLVIDFGSAQVLDVNPMTGTAVVFATVTGGAGLNALAFDRAGNVYISDSFQGIIWKTGPGGGAATAWVTSPLLTTAGVPPFGANGLGFDKAGNTLYVANTGNDTIVQIPVTAAGTAGTPTVLTNSINGADGLIVDADDNIWVAANQSDEIVVVDKTGKAIAKLGDFDGIDRDRAPVGFLFPASLVRVGDWIYVSNLSLDLTKFGFNTVDARWAAEVQTQTLSRIRARIPRVRD